MVEAIELLKVAEIDIVISTALLPAQETMMHRQDASALLSQGKFFKANRALKTIEDSVVFDAFELDTIPAQTQ